MNRALRARLAGVVGVVEKRSDARIIDIRSTDEFSGRIIAPPSQRVPASGCWTDAGRAARAGRRSERALLARPTGIEPVFSP